MFTSEYLEANLKKRRKAIKGCLLDQSIIAGIGNIYADEILFAAGIFPARPADSLEKADFARLSAVIPERLAYFTEKNKITPEEYLKTKGQEYHNTPFLNVYRARRQAVSRLRYHPNAHSYRRQKQRLLSSLSKTIKKCCARPAKRRSYLQHFSSNLYLYLHFADTAISAHHASLSRARFQAAFAGLVDGSFTASGHLCRAASSAKNFKYSL